MKTSLSFLSGLLVCVLLLFGMQAVLPIRAETASSNLTSDNFSLVNLLPDIEKIYREALTSPLQQAKSKIYDEDLAEFYELLLEKSALNEVEDTP